MISILKTIKQTGLSFIKWFYPVNTLTRYLNFEVYHHKNDSLIQRIKSAPDELYEPQETALLTKALAQFKNPVMLDIGANIGLMSLNVLNANPSVRIHAFEPGQNQYGFLRKNIYCNHLEARVSTYNVALGSFNGVSDFFIHKTKDSSGDGFVDTGRGGIATKTSVKTSTLDDWWIANGRPHINVIKIDTEGSELSVLSHATALLSTCRPFILIEICHLNYDKYNLSFDDHIRFFNDVKYGLFESKSGVRVGLNSGIWKDEYYYTLSPDN